MAKHKTSYLVPEYPLILLPKLAEAIGLNEAIIIQQLHYWIIHVGQNGERYGRVHEGKRWIRNSIDDWKERNFPFLSRSAIHRALASLEDQKLVLSTNTLNALGYDRTKWYTIDYDAIPKWDMDISNGDMEQLKMGYGMIQNGTTIPETIKEITAEKTKEKTTVIAGVFSLYESEIGKPKGMEKNLLYEVIKKYPEDWIRKAIKECAVNNVRKFSYMEAILARMAEDAGQFVI